MKTITDFVVRAIAFCWQYAWPVIAAGICCLPIASSWYAATHFNMSTNMAQLISSDIPWRQREAALEKAFPHFQSIVAVINAPTPELADEATGALVQRLSQQKHMFISIEDPAGGPFFAQNGLLFLDTQGSRRAHDHAHAGDAAHSGAGRRSQPARRAPGAAIRAAWRAGRPHHARRHDLADDACGRHDREGECGKAGEFFLARTGAGQSGQAR